MASCSRKRAKEEPSSCTEDSESESESESDSDCDEEPESSNPHHHCNTKGSVSVSLTDPSVLDCEICFEPLTAPVTQCKNGHIACDQCCKKLKNNKCPSCKLHIGSIRCRAIENILESIRVSCQNTNYGCNQTSMPYILKRHHDTTCVYTPCPCPFANCDYQSSAKELSPHLNQEHPDCLRNSFKYDSTFSIKLDWNAECIVLEEDKEGDLFAITSYVTDSFGRAVVVSRIIGTTVQRRHPYELTAKIDEPDHEGISTLKIQSFTRNHVPRRNGMSSSCRTPPSAGTFLVIPKHSLGSGFRQVMLSLCIHPSI